MAAGGSKCCADYSERSVVVGGTVAPEVILSIINATAVKIKIIIENVQYIS